MSRGILFRPAKQKTHPFQPLLCQPKRQQAKENRPKCSHFRRFYGPDRIRTDDPHNANVMRSQLRYRPKYLKFFARPHTLRHGSLRVCLTHDVRSQLSYEPEKPVFVCMACESGGRPSESLAHRLSTQKQMLLYHIPPECKALFPYFITSAKDASTISARSAGLSTTCIPIFPADTAMASYSWASSWITVGKGFFMPMGLHPPRT